MKKLSDKEKKAALLRLSIYMKKIEESVYGIINEINSSEYSSIDKNRRTIRLKQSLLGIKVEYNKIKLRYDKDDTSS